MATDHKAVPDDITERTGSSDDAVDEAMDHEHEVLGSDVSSEPSSTTVQPVPNQPRNFPPLNKSIVCTLLPMEINILNVPLAPHMRSLVERKIYDLTEPVYYDQVHSTNEDVYLYYIENTGLVTRLKFIASPTVPLKFVDLRYVANAYPLEYVNANDSDVLEDRMRFSMRFVHNDKVFISNGRGKVSVHHMKREPPYEWIPVASFFIPYGSDNVFDTLPVHFALPNRKGYPTVITDAKTHNMAYDVLVVTPIHRPAYARKPGQTEVATKIFWLSLCNPQNDKMLKVVRHRVLEVDGIFESALLSDKGDEINVIASQTPVCVYDSAHPTPNRGVRDIISFAPLVFNYEWFQSATTVLLVFTYKKFVCENDFNCEFKSDSISVVYHRNALIAGKLGGTIDTRLCRTAVRHSFNTNYGTFTVELTKGEIGKHWEFAVNHPHRGIEKKSVTSDPEYNTININVYDAKSHEIRDVKLEFNRDALLFTGLPHVPNMFIPIGNQLLEFSYRDGTCQNNVTLEDFKGVRNGGKIYSAIDNQYFVQMLENKNMLIQRYKSSTGEFSDVDYLCAPERTMPGENIPEIIGVVPLLQGMVFFTKDRIYVTRIC